MVARLPRVNGTPVPSLVISYTCSQPARSTAAPRARLDFAAPFR